jgi:hypothetical protein
MLQCANIRSETGTTIQELRISPEKSQMTGVSVIAGLVMRKLLQNLTLIAGFDELATVICSYFEWGEKRGSNPRQPESQSGTLPTELFPP